MVLHRPDSELIVLRSDIGARSSCCTSAGAPVTQCHPGSFKGHCSKGFRESQVDSCSWTV